MVVVVAVAAAVKIQTKKLLRTIINIDQKFFYSMVNCDS